MKHLLILLSILSLLSTGAHATTVTLNINPTHANHCINSLPRCFGDQNRGPAFMSPGSLGISNFLLFDLPDIQGTVTNVSLRIAAGQGVYRTQSSSVVYELRAINVPRTLLSTRQDGQGAQTVVDAIQSGAELGRTTILTPVTNFTDQMMPEVTVDLTGARQSVQDALGSSIQFGSVLGGVGLIQLFQPTPEFNLSASNASLRVDIAPTAVPLSATGGLSLFALLMLLGVRRSLHARASF